jgi:hypothetical protein
MVRRVSRCLLPALIVGLACARTAPGSEGESESETGGELPYHPLKLASSRSVDVLFVIDNSASMAPAQARLAAAIDVFVDALEVNDTDYRIGITTTDNGNPWCSSQPTGGQLLASSCTSRLDDFVLDGGTVDARALACTDLCTLSPAELEIQPTTIDHYDPNPAPRPWIEKLADQSNLPPGTDVAEALRCMLPQGIAGCEFESPLESMHRALSTWEMPESSSYGFRRVDAMLLVVFLSDAGDCSYAPDWEEIFAVDGLKTFWSNPDASAPTPAVCWNAGVECEGDPAGYDSCNPADKAVDGQLETVFEDTVLYPLWRYGDRLDDIDSSIQEYVPGFEVVVAVIGGVDEAGVSVYADASDPGFQESYGIGPGCVGQNPLDPNVPQQAIPPVRLRALAEQFTYASLYSICSDSYVDMLANVAADVTSLLEPACNYYCVKDMDPAPGVQPDCTLERSAVDLEADEEVLECARENGVYVLDPDTGHAQLPTPDTDVCYVLRVDTDGSSLDPLDDMSEECDELNFNLEFELVRRPGVPDPPGTNYVPLCIIADYPDVSCPGIGS